MAKKRIFKPNKLMKFDRTSYALSDPIYCKWCREYDGKWVELEDDEFLCLKHTIEWRIGGGYHRDIPEKWKRLVKKSIKSGIPNYWWEETKKGRKPKYAPEIGKIMTKVRGNPDVYRWFKNRVPKLKPSDGEIEYNVEEWKIARRLAKGEKIDIKKELNHLNEDKELNKERIDEILDRLDILKTIIKYSWSMIKLLDYERRLYNWGVIGKSKETDVHNITAEIVDIEREIIKAESKRETNKLKKKHKELWKILKVMLKIVSTNRCSYTQKIIFNKSNKNKKPYYFTANPLYP